MDSNENMASAETVETCDSKIRGHLKVFIGYAPGVGKTFSMLNEGNRRLKYGEDVVIGYVQTYGRIETEKQICDLEIIPRKKIIYNKTESEEMDTDAIIARNPQTVLIDELAHINASGFKHKRRYEDVEEILSHGINVITTMNIQHMESLNDVVHQITGIKVKETIPDYILQRADEVVVVDLTPDALQNRLKRGNVYDEEKAAQALKTFFRKGNLNALRELALRQTAEEVDEDLSEYMKKECILDNWHTVERVMVCISPSPSAKKLIRRGARVAYRYKCEWYVVTVNCTNRFAKKVTLKDRQMLHTHFQLAKQLGGEIITLTGKSVSEELARWANERHVTQIIMGHPTRTKLETMFRGSTVNKLIKKVKNVEIHLIPNDM